MEAVTKINDDHARAPEKRTETDVGKRLLSGCAVVIFHDVPLDSGGNVDYVLLTPIAVYAIETKMRKRKRVRASEHPAHRVRYDGDARWLAEFLTKANAAEVPVTAVLALPNWEIRQEARGDVTVVSHKELKALAGFRPQGQRALSVAEVKRICFALSERAMCEGL